MNMPASVSIPGCRHVFLSLLIATYSIRQVICFENIWHAIFRQFLLQDIVDLLDFCFRSSLRPGYRRHFSYYSSFAHLVSQRCSGKSQNSRRFPDSYPAGFFPFSVAAIKCALSGNFNHGHSGFCYQLLRL